MRRFRTFFFVGGCGYSLFRQHKHQHQYGRVLSPAELTLQGQRNCSIAMNAIPPYIAGYFLMRSIPSHSTERFYSTFVRKNNKLILRSNPYFYVALFTLIAMHALDICFAWKMGEGLTDHCQASLK